MTPWMPQALKHLKGQEPFGDLMKIHGKPTWVPTSNPMEALAGSLIFQQLSGKAASTIYGRFEALMPDRKVTPEAVMAQEHEVLRAVGLSGQKAIYVKELAKAFLAGQVPDDLGNLSDAEIRTVLKPIKGIGDWTIDMFLLFDLCRPDIWPTGDLGVRKGVAIVLGMKN